MAKYLSRTCPKCKDYLGVVVPEPPEPVKEIPIDARCLRCGFKLAWKVVMGRKSISGTPWDRKAQNKRRRHSGSKELTLAGEGSNG